LVKSGGTHCRKPGIAELLDFHRWYLSQRIFGLLSDGALMMSAIPGMFTVNGEVPAAAPGAGELPAISFPHCPMMGLVNHLPVILKSFRFPSAVQNST
jgi:hypothetical protein